MQKMVSRCRWSPATFLYMHGCFLYMQAEEAACIEEQKELSQLAMGCFEKLLAMKKGFTLKRAFQSRMVVVNSRKFLANQGRVVMPALEVMYFWNFFQLASCKAGGLELIADKIEAKFCHFTEKDDLETFCWLTFMKGVCLAHQNRAQEAIACFMKILDR